MITSGEPVTAPLSSPIGAATAATPSESTTAARATASDQIVTSSASSSENTTAKAEISSGNQSGKPSTSSAIVSAERPPADLMRLLTSVPSGSAASSSSATLPGSPSFAVASVSLMPSSHMSLISSS